MTPDTHGTGAYDRDEHDFESRTGVVPGDALPATRDIPEIVERPDPPSLQALLTAVVRQRGWQARLRGARIHSEWPRIAGPQLASHVLPVRLAGGVLVLRAESPAWATQVSYLAPQLLARANVVLGEGQVTRVTITAG